MPYHAIENMQQQNRERFGLPDGVDRPLIPELKPSKYYDYPALLFIRDSCTDLRFEDAIEKCKTDEEKERVRAYRDNRGKSITKNQIPALMEKDLDRMCLERALADFLALGTDSSAFTVYYCYLEMFWNTGAANHRKLENMLKLLSQFEHSASPLLLSHRDHFVHCVYVFSIGLAIYQQSQSFRSAYETHYGLNGEKAAHHFLKYWGFTALFHDLGYPFELVYEQINSCFEMKASGGAGFYLSYQNKHKRSGFNARFASELADRLYDKFRRCPDYKSFLKGEEDTREQYLQYLRKTLDRKPSDPHSFGDYMDHAYFSAFLLLHRLWPRSQWNSIKKDDWDALTAIMLHNSLFKHTILLDAPSIGSYPRMEMSTHPLAFLLMLCDELQCWNRFGYGRKTRQENHPFDCVLTVENDKISATYLFDRERIDDCSGTYKKFCGSGDPCTFVKDLEYILMVNCDRGLQLEFDTDFDDLPEYSKEPLSHSSFIDTYQLAAILHSEYITRPKYTPLRKKRPFDPEKIEEEQRIKYFDELSLE